MRGLCALTALAIASWLWLSDPQSPAAKPAVATPAAEACDGCERFAPSEHPLRLPPVKTSGGTVKASGGTSTDDFRRATGTQEADKDLDWPADSAPSNGYDPVDDRRPDPSDQLEPDPMDRRPGGKCPGCPTDLVADNPCATEKPPRRGHWETRRSGLFGRRLIQVWVE
jgi:hypothetical protein